ncbi:uncharacterized protein DSM5745_03217 [Aspergillus mulundensis]|uniref:Uncharacterized protein n=1 Tax=Aspergillus mulundensis TaxID=1810919 RepID=A0A3D8SJR4_9EURO|nr:Uncharacterized protein DSM5745_03217 [Aspergillus mulundensis]RDW86575.1 Uncharacterized protein DSM5745_03217 [Aspergillus mulundensis]
MSADEGGGTLMAAPNGERSTATPDPSILATPGKRKRVSSQDDKAAHEATATALMDERAKLQETLRNLVDILSKNDTELQLLSCPLPSSPVKPRSKRARIAGEKEEAPSIQARVASDRYATLSEFLSDIEKASAAVIERNKAQASGPPTDGTPVTETVNRIAAFKKLLNSLVRQAHVTPANIKSETPGNETESSEKPIAAAEEVRNGGLVLTLFGNPANPKQLYSSLQKSVKVPLSSDESESKKYVEVQTPLPEVGLPNGITTTKVPPYDDDKKPKVAKRTFGEVFAPKATLPQLELPRRARRTSQITWIDPFDAVTNYKAFLGDRNNYAFAQFPSGNWLQYGGVTSSPSFWGRRQKQQSSQQHSEERYHEDPILWADDDAAILQGVYSSFVPSFDSSNAVVQADSKNLVWWNKRGAKRLNVLLSIADQGDAQDTTVQPGSIGDLDESTLDEMVKSWNLADFADASVPSDAAENDEQKADKTSEEKDTEDLLAEISDLLETLSSYQKIRHLEFPASTQGSAPSQSAEAKETPSAQTAPDKPSEAEQEVYETLRSSLSVLVSQLPPFAVAKLNGDQLAELNISQKILVESTDYPGNMEKDEYTIQQERAAAAATNPVANRTSTPSRPANYQQYNQRTFSANTQIQPQRNFQAPQPYYPQRQPSTPGAYTPGNPQHFQASRPPATPGQRPGYFPGYGQPAPQFNQGNPVPQYQRPGQNGYNPYSPQPGSNPPQGSPQHYTPRPGQPTPYNAAPYGPGRSASPQKPPSYAAPRAPYNMPPAGTPQQRFMPHPQPQQQPPSGYANYTPNQTPNTYSNSAAAVTYARSAAEQAALMDRNRVQLAAQGSPAPQPQPIQDYRVSHDRSVTPGTKQSATPVPS